MQAEFPASKGFSTTNLFYVTYGRFEKVQQAAGELPDAPVPQPRQGAKSGERKLNQAGSQLERQKLKQVDSETQFPPIFSLVPWKHHVVIIQKCKNVEEALFYIEKTIADSLSRSALENCIRADLYHTARAAVTNFAETLPDAQGKLAQDLLKGNYDFGFVQLAEVRRAPVIGQKTFLRISSPNTRIIKRVDYWI